MTDKELTQALEKCFKRTPVKSKDSSYGYHRSRNKIFSDSDRGFIARKEAKKAAGI